MLRLSDLMGVMRLSRLQAEIVANRIATADIATYLARNPRLFDPYTGQALQWNTRSRQIGVTQKSRREQGRPVFFLRTG